MNRFALQSKETRAALFVRAAAVLFIAIAGFPADFFPVSAGLDSSWVWGVNRYFNSPWRFGTDVNFTYGPLAFLLYPINLGNDIVASIVFRGAVSAAFAAVLWAGFAGEPLGAVLFAIAHAVALGLGMPFEFQLLLMIGFAAYVAVRFESVAGLAILALCAGPLALTKFTIGIGALPMVLVASGVIAARLRRPAVAIVPAAVFFASTLAAGFLAMSFSWRAVFDWIRASLEIAGSYSVVMSFDPGWTDQWIGLSLVALAAVSALLLYRWLPAAALPSLLMGAPLFLAFKAGFIREDPHVKTCYSFFVAGLAVPFAAARSVRARAVVGAGVAVAFAAGLLGEIRRDYLTRAQFLDSASGARGAGGIANALQSGKLKARLDGAVPGSLVPDLLPAADLAQVDPASVTVFPWELADCAANALDCTPLVTLQAYHVCTPYLDGRSAEQFSASRGTSSVIFHTLLNPDGRNVLVDSPLTVESMLMNYRVAVSDGEKAAVLRKREDPRAMSERELGSIALREGAWVPVPDAEGWIAARIDFRLTVRGQLNKLLVRIPAAYLDLRRASGKTERARLTLETTVNGAFIEPYAREVADLSSFFEGAHPDRVVAMRISGRALRFYGSQTRIVWVARNFR
jgi:hypothetical protein